MTPELALQLLTQVTATYQGTRQDHSKIQEALKVISELIKSPKPKSKSN